MDDGLEALLGLGIGAGVVFIFVLIGLLPTIFYLLTLHKTFEEISPENRLMPSGQVWLILIPLFGMIWQFIVVTKMADSLKQEFALRGIEHKDNRPGYSIGIAYCILSLSGIIPFLGFLGAIAGLVCWIVYWVTINDFRNLLIRNPLNQVIS